MEHSDDEYDFMEILLLIFMCYRAILPYLLITLGSIIFAGLLLYLF
jgi:hypothetical protein